MLDFLKFWRKTGSSISICTSVNEYGLIDNVKIVAQGEDSEDVAWKSGIATQMILDAMEKCPY